MHGIGDGFPCLHLLAAVDPYNKVARWRTHGGGGETGQQSCLPRTWDVKVSVSHGAHNGALCDEQPTLAGTLAVVRLHVWLRDVAHCAVTGERRQHDAVFQGVVAQLDRGEEGVGPGAVARSGGSAVGAGEKMT